MKNPAQNKEEAFIFGPCVGELHWEFFRFAGHAIWLKKKHPNVKLVVFTRIDRYDIYGRYADCFLPLYVDEGGRIQDCFKLHGLDNRTYHELAGKVRKIFSNMYHIRKHYYPDLKRYTERWQWPEKQMDYDFRPRQANDGIVKTHLDSKPIVVLAPRFRKNERKRNWPFWKDLYKRIEDSGLINSHTFVICAKEPDSVSADSDAILDINNMLGHKDVSLIGLSINFLRNAVLTVGSQSGIPNLSVLVKTPVLSWGHQKERHAKRLNPFKTPVTFLEDRNYKLPDKVVFNKIKELLVGGRHEYYGQQL